MSRAESGEQTTANIKIILTALGYLPAEHIETPLERLARLNKHRNIDVSLQPMDVA